MSKEAQIGAPLRYPIGLTIINVSIMIRNKQQLTEGKQNMKKSKIIMRAVLTVIFILGAFLLYRYLPGNERMELTEYYGTGDGEAPVIVNSENTDTGAWLEEGTWYLPVEGVQEYLNPRFYWDGTYLLYTLPDRTVSYIPGEAAYYDGTEKKENIHVSFNGREEKSVPGCIIREGTLWVDLYVINRYTNMTWSYAENPTRIWIWSSWEQPVKYAQIEKKCRLRYRAGIKKPHSGRFGGREPGAGAG